jgi:hypothetical protein
MEMDEIKHRMDDLERKWFEAHRAAEAARKLFMIPTVAWGRGLNVGLGFFCGFMMGYMMAPVRRIVNHSHLTMIAQDCLRTQIEKAEYQKQQIMQEIEATEDELLD